MALTFKRAGLAQSGFASGTARRRFERFTIQVRGRIQQALAVMGRSL
jgi:hypothetical protein